MKFPLLLIPALAVVVFAGWSCERHSWQETKHLHEKVMHKEKEEKGEGDKHSTPLTGPAKHHENRGADPSPTITTQTDKTQVKAEPAPHALPPTTVTTTPSPEAPAKSAPTPAPVPATSEHPAAVPTTPLIQQP